MIFYAVTFIENIKNIVLSLSLSQSKIRQVFRRKNAVSTLSCIIQLNTDFSRDNSKYVTHLFWENFSLSQRLHIGCTIHFTSKQEILHLIVSNKCPENS